MRICRGWVRILLPFQLSWGEGSKGPLDALASTFGKDGNWLGLDSGSDNGEFEKIAHSEYLKEHLPHVQAFLFGAVGATGCRYLRLKPDRVPPLLALERANVWTKYMDPKGRRQVAPGRPSARGLQLLGIAAEGPVWKATLPFESPKHRLPLRVTLDARSGIELWMSRLGAGLISILFECEPADSAASENDGFFRALLDLNHALATAQKSVWLRRAGDLEPGEDASAESRVTHGTPEPPNAEEGEAKHLHQIVRELLEPIRDLQGVRLLFDQRGVVYTAIEVERPLPCDAGFGNELRRKLSHLAQVHPSTHPGEDDGLYSCSLRINKHHACVMTLSGAAHASILPAPAAGEQVPVQGGSAVVRDAGDDGEADQEEALAESAHEDSRGARPSEFDLKRLRWIQYEYFPGFLLAQLQRLCLQRLLDESSQASNLEPGEGQDAAQRRLLEQTLRFGLEGEFVLACWRTTLQKHHELAQRTCEVPQGLDALRQAMADFNRMAMDRAAHRQREEAEKAEQHRHEEAQRAALHRHVEAEKAEQHRHHEKQLAASHREKEARRSEEEKSRTERAMQILEVFIVSVYSMELFHTLATSFGLENTDFFRWSLIAVVVLTLLAVTTLVTWRPRKECKTAWTILLLSLAVGAIQGGGLTVNYLRVPPSTLPDSPSKVETRSDSETGSAKPSVNREPPSSNRH